MTVPQLSVIICTYNPRADYLRRTLDALRSQTLDHALWELLIVDNASTNGFGAGIDLSWHANARLVQELEMGLTMARIKGIEATHTDLLVFVDDDNVLRHDYLQRMVGLMREFPFLGVVGAGRIEPEFEEEPADELRPFLPMLALRSIPGAAWSNDPRDNSVPWGAGMCVRRVVATKYLETLRTDPARRSLDRAGSSLNSCGDDEFSWVACEMGLGKGIFDALEVLHLIGRSRVQREYMLRLAEGHSYSKALLFHLHGVRVPRTSERPSWRSVLGRLAALRLSEAKWEASRLLDGRQGTRERMKADIERARADGLERFRRTVLIDSARAGAS